VGITEKQKQNTSRKAGEGICFPNCPFITEEKFSAVRCPPTTQQKSAQCFM
jgi:hypothetical protein